MLSRIILIFLVWLLSGQPVLAAVSCSVLTQNQDISNASSYATASVTPSSNALVLVATEQTRNAATACTDNDVSSVTGNGLTWVLIARQCFSDAGVPTHTVEIWRSMGASPSTGAITIATGGASQVHMAWAVAECTGTDTSGTNGSGAIVQSATNLIEPGTSLTVTLGAFGDAGNATLGAFGVADNVAVTEGTGFTEIAEQLVSDGGLDSGLQVQWRNDNDTTVDASWSSIDAGGVAIEIKAAATAADTSGDVLWFH